MPVEIIQGPPTKEFSRTAAEQALTSNPDFPKDAEFEITAHAGQWIAAIHHSAPPPFAPGDEEEESPPPKGEGLGEGPSDNAGPDDSDSDDDAEAGPPEPKKEKSDKPKGGAELHEVITLLHTLLDALGVAPDPGASPVPGPDAPVAPPGPPPPHGGPPGGGPGGKGGLGLGSRPLKPGDTPPGGTPLGAPAFASVNPDHPWAHTVGKVSHFKVAEDVGDQDMTEVEDELQQLAKAGGFRVASFRPFRGEDGSRRVEATIATPKLSE